MASRFYYNQTWEDPCADLHALQLNAECRVVAIASAGCNLLNYLAHGCGSIAGVDINAAHLHVAALRLAALKHLPDHDTFFRFFGDAAQAENIASYESHLRRHLSDDARQWWERRNLMGRRPIDAFANGFYRHGWCGAFFHYQVRAAQLMGRRPEKMLECTSRHEQQVCFNREILPGFRMPLLKHLCEYDAFLSPICIPAQQLKRLRDEDTRPLLEIFLERTRRILCDFDVSDNYFAWQVCTQRYDTEKRIALPDYLQAEHYEPLKQNIDRIRLHHAGITEFLRRQPESSIDRYVLLDAQDWMDTEQLNILWREIVRTARTGARILFRTLASSSPVESPGFDRALRQRFCYDKDVSRECRMMDRSAIYGGLHLYVLNA